MVEHQIEIEKEFLGMLFVSKKTAEKLINDVDETYFTKESHRALYKAAKTVLIKNEYFDLTLICEYLDPEYYWDVMDIHHHGITDSLYDHYLDRLSEHTTKRQLKSIQDDDISVEGISEILDRLKIKVRNKSDIAEINIRDIEQYLSKADDNNFSPGWVKFAEHYRISRGQLCIITGIPSHGKSAFIDQIVMNIADKYEWKTLYFSPENLPVKKHIFKFIRMKYGNFNDLPSKIMWIKRHMSFLDPEPESRTIKNILDHAKGYDMLVIDPWNELESERPKEMTETEYIGQSIKLIKAHAVRENIHVIIAAHPTKLQRNDQGQYPVPRPYDISGSANWLNKADVCFSVYRPDVQGGLGNVTEIHVQKVRFQPENGQLGIVKFKFEDFKYYELSL